jgi:hypothetical protein
MDAWSFLILWVACLALQLGFAAAACRPWAASGESRGHRPVYAAAAASIVPLITLGLFVRVFVIGRTSNVAQLAGEEGFRMWALWMEAWPLLLFCNLLAMVALMTALATPPWRWASVLSRMAAFLFVMCAWCALLKWAPMA